MCGMHPKFIFKIGNLLMPFLEQYVLNSLNFRLTEGKMRRVYMCELMFLAIG